MRDCSKNRRGYDRVLMTVAATFLAVSATSALAQGDNAPRNTAAELAIDAAVPRPEPANVPPPGPGDFKLDTSSAPEAAKVTEKTPPETKTAKPADVVTVPISEPTKIETGQTDTPKADTAKSDTAKSETTKVETPKDEATSGAPAETPSAASTPEPVKAASNVAPADQPV